ncbi:MAG TPA: NAD(P)-dependent oxidoreductase [Chitinophagales bacterium]|nr:NAD(P)-dependent oxidoreductase [Chitinophagales bacterium]HPR27761.1 NAD(P)-dependent oxidoreductase [Chitinophagales bacterium]
MKIGLIREGKFPPDSRVALTPEQCTEVMRTWPDINIVVQPSHGRCYTDAEYGQAGITLQENLSDCDVLIGIKEVPVESLISHKTYLFFSHTIKEQPYNRKLLQTLLKQQIRMIDYETLHDEQGNRVIAFGRWAGIVGAHNAFWTWSRRNGGFKLTRARDCHDFAELKTHYSHLQLPPLRIVVTGTGRVARGSMEVMELLKIRQVTPEEFLTSTCQEPVVVNLDSHHLFERISDGGYERAEFHRHPERYRSAMHPYLSKSDILVNGIYWNPHGPRLFEKTDMHADDFSIQVIADISCDVDGSVPATVRTTTISEPVFGYNKYTDETTAPFESDTIDIMAVDNLPNELPRDASAEFGRRMIEAVIPDLMAESSRMLDEATICNKGELQEAYLYLSDFAGVR